MISDFYPFQPNQKVTAEQWNELFAAVADGSIFLDTSAISTQISTFATRLSAAEIELVFLREKLGRNSKREQFVLTAGQTIVTLQTPPLQDSEMYALNGSSLSKSGYPLGFVGDLTLSGAIITFNPELSNQIKAGDVFVAWYQYNV